MNAKDVLGQQGEQLAASFLAKAGLLILERNWRCKQGEIDIVALDGRTLVICEVKTRSGRAVRDADRGDHAAEGLAAAEAGRALGQRTRPDLRGDQDRRRRRPAVRCRATSPSSTFAGWARWHLPAPTAMALAGVRGHVVEIEADIENGLVALLLVGLPDTALREARDRIRSAIVNSRQTWPQRRITVGLSPASLPKRGSGFDAAIAVAILSADGVGAQGAAGRARCSWASSA